MEWHNTRSYKNFKTRFNGAQGIPCGGSDHEEVTAPTSYSGKCNIRKNFHKIVVMLDTILDMFSYSWKILYLLNFCEVRLHSPIIKLNQKFFCKFMYASHKELYICMPGVCQRKAKVTTFDLCKST